MIEESIKKRMSIFDFIQGSESYKYKWTKEELKLYKAFTSQIKLVGFLWKISRKIRYIIYNSNIIKKVYQLSIGKIKKLF